MNFLKNQSQTISDEEVVNELANCIRVALKKTSDERTEGLKLTKSQISKIISLIRKFKFDKNAKKKIFSLEGVINEVLKDSEDSEIKSILSQQSEIYNQKQSEFKNSDEYKVAIEICKIYEKYPSLDNKFNDFLNSFKIASCEHAEDNNIHLTCQCDESRLISYKNSNAVFIICDGKLSLKPVTAEKSEKAK